MTEKKNVPCTTAIVQSTKKSSQAQLKNTIESARSQAFSLASDFDVADIQLSDFVHMLGRIQRDMECELNEIENSSGEKERNKIRCFLVSCKYTVVTIRTIEYALDCFLREYKSRTECAYDVSNTLRKLLETMEN